MAGQPLIATITGIPNVLDVNVRSGPSRDFQAVFKSPKGTTGLRVIEVQADGKSAALQGKMYQWLRLQFPDGQNGWVRDDLLSVVGDGGMFGYGVFTSPAVPFYVVRTASVGAAGSMSAPAQAVVAAPPVVQASPSITVTTPTTLPTPTTAGTSTQVTVQSVQTPPTTVPQVTVGTPQVVVGSPQVTVGTPVAPQVAAPAAVTITVTGPAMAMCMNKGGGNVRPGPGQNNNPVLTKMNYRDSAQILEVKQGDANDYFKWVKVAYQGKEGWIREDFLRFSGTISKFGYAEDLYPSPAPDSWWVRDFDVTGQVSGLKHDGWDHAGSVGATIQAGPKGAFIVKTQECQKCGPEGASAVDKGFSMGDSRVWNDAGWNYGYGHYLIARYDNVNLPASTQQFLNSKGWGGYHAFVMYAHLSKIIAQTGQTVAGGQEIAKLGNSGNSTGTHLHLELRFGKDANAQWPTITTGLVSPTYLFFR